LYSPNTKIKIKGKNALTISPFLEIGDNKVKARNKIMEGHKRAPPQTYHHCKHKMDITNNSKI
jgi:hypothetical protein